MLTGIIPYAHELLKQSVRPHDHVIDATCGNGNDTLFLAQLVGAEGHVYACDIQEQAIENTKQKISEHNINNVTFINDSHEHINKYIPESVPKHIGGAIFNLGYLPGSDKTIVTKAESTIKAVESMLPLLRSRALVILVVYHGHEGGINEKTKLLPFVESLEQKKYSVLKYQFINQINNPPFIIAIQKN